MLDFHEVWGYVAIVANAVAGLIALLGYVASGVPRRAVWAATIAAESAMLLQVVVGVLLVADDRYSVARFHVFYGVLAFATIAIAYSYRKSMRSRAELYYGLIGLFVMGLGIRAIVEVGS